MVRSPVWIASILPLVAFSSVLGAAAVHFEPVRSENGSPPDVVTALLQDRQGFVWIGSREGLTLFDGYTFTSFVHDPSDPTSISDNAIRTLFEDSHGRLWIGTNTGGLNRLDRGVFTFAHFRHDSADEHTLSHDSVYAIAETADGALWVGTQKGLNRFEPDTGRAERFGTGDDGGRLGHEYVTALVTDRTGGLWVGTVGGGLNLIDPRTGRLEVLDHGPTQALPRGIGDVFALLATGSGDLVVGTGAGLFLMNESTRSFRRFISDPGEPGAEAAPLVTSLSAGRAGKVWVGTHGHGLEEADLTSRTLRAIRGDTPLEEGIGDQRVISLLSDRSGALWVGTWGAGLKRLTESALHLAAVTRKLPVPADIVDLDVTALGSDHLGGLWIGTRSGSLLRRDPAVATWRRFSGPEKPTILQVAEGPGGDIWVGTSEGLSRVQPATGEVVRYRHLPGDPSSLGPGYVPAFLVDREGRLWVGTGEGGVHQIDREGRVLRRFLHDAADPGTLSDNYVTVLRQDRAGRLWVGTRSGGLNALDPATGRVTRYMPRAGQDDSFSHHHVTSILEDARGRLWIGTDGGGLNRADDIEAPGGARFTRYATAAGLSDDNIMAILQDDDGTLWISTKRGVSRFDPDSETFTNFLVADGLPSAEFEPGAAARAGKVLHFGSVKWIAAIAAGTPRTTTAPAPTVITSIRTLSRNIRGGNPVTGLDRLEIPHGEWLSIELAVLDFDVGGSHRYAYRLDEGNPSWVELGSRRAITFSKLAPGTYDFVARGRGRQAVFSETTPVLKVVVVPPFWMTTWFRVVAGLGLLAAAVAVHRVRLSTLERRNLELLNLQEQREVARKALAGAYDRLTLLTRRLEAAKEEERKSIARELHDEMGPALTAVVINLQLLAAGNDQAKTPRRIADSIEIVDRMVQKVRDVSLDLRPPLLDEMGLVPALKGYLETQAERTGIEIEVRGDNDLMNLPPEVEITAFRVAQEAVTNVIRHASASRVVVTIAHRSGKLEIGVVDDGRGFDVRATMEALSTGKALGLLGMQERARMLGGEFRIEATPGQGTSVRVVVPVEGIA